MTKTPLEIRKSCTRSINGSKLKSVQTLLTELAESPLAEGIADRYGEGEAISSLEREVALLVGKEAGVFVIKGIIAQQMALRVWTDHSGVPTVAIHPMSHIDSDERGAYERLHSLRGVRLGGHEPFRVKDLQAASERLGAVTVELPLRRAGFKLLPWEELVAISDWCKEHEVPLHFDGARLWEAAPYYGRDYAEIAALADSVYVSFYKGLGGLGGAILAGPTDFITEAKVWKTRHGGDLFTAFPYVISAQRGLKERLPRLGGYYARACELAAALSTIPGITIVPNPPHTNEFQIYLPGKQDQVAEASFAISEETGVWLLGMFVETALPNMTMSEIAVGDAIEEVSNEEIVSLFTSLLEHAQE